MFDLLFKDDIPKYFDNPTRVEYDTYADATLGKRWIGGIAYRGYIICGCCGQIINLSEINKLKVYHDWKDISEVII